MLYLGNILNNLNYKLVLVFIYSLFATFVAAEYLYRKFRKKGFTVVDMYKKNKPHITNLGGVAALVGVMIAIVLAQILVKEFSTANLLIFYFIVIINASFGLIDDLISINNTLKIIAPYFMALPIALLVSDVRIGPWPISMGVLFVYFIAPIYILVVTNLVNTHSGYNGLASGLSWIIMLTMAIRTIIMGDIEKLFFLVPVFGALSVLIFFDRYPAKAIWGNVGSMMMGSAIGAYLIVTNTEIFGIIILFPHIVDFILYLYGTFIKKEKFEKVKFGKIREDGTIIPPTKYKLKFLLPYYFRLNEKQTTWILYGITALFCVIGLVVGV
ncbi:MAG: hypothetical protein QXG00_03680 [Candidatus Woesearchaeota archaeon]